MFSNASNSKNPTPYASWRNTYGTQKCHGLYNHGIIYANNVIMNADLEIIQKKVDGAMTKSLLQ